MELLYKEVFAIRIVLFQTLHYFLWSVTLVITHRIVNGRQVIRSLKNSLLLGVANAKFSLLKLLIYEPYYLCLSRLECQA